MQEKGINYWETYAPVVQCMSVRIILTLAAIENLHTKLIDFVLAYPQADLDVDIYTELPQGFNVGPESGRYVLKLQKNLYGLKQAGHNWFENYLAHLRSYQPTQAKWIPVCSLETTSLCKYTLTIVLFFRETRKR